MKIKILKTTTASACPLGIYSKEYVEGSVVDMYSDLANIFISQSWGVKFKEEPIEEKSIPEDKIKNKAIDKAPENKSFSKPKSKAKKKK